MIAASVDRAAEGSNRPVARQARVLAEAWCTPSSALTLQASAGNAALCRTLRSRPSQRVLARDLRLKLTTDAAGVVTAASLDGRLPTNIQGGAQGQHTTSDVAIKALIENAVIGQTFAAAAANLQAELTHASYLPGVQSGASAHLERHWTLPHPNPTNRQELIEDIFHVARVRGQIDLTAYGWPKSKPGKPAPKPPGSGVNEGQAVGGLNVLERDLRNHPGVAPPGNYARADVEYSMWDLFHFNPRQAADDAEVAAALIQHAYTIHRAFPLVSQHFNVTYLTLLADLFAGNNSYVRRFQHSYRPDIYLEPLFVGRVRTRLAAYAQNNRIPQYGGAGNAAYAPRIAGWGYALQ